VAFLWPRDQGPFGTRGSLTTPPRAAQPRKISSARRSRATLRRELVRRQDTGIPAQQTQRSPDAARPVGSVEPSGVDGCRGQPRAGHWLHPGKIRLRLSARPGRPPSRPRNRPRATGKSASAAAFAPDAATSWACAMSRTCVRTVGRASDGTRTNRCLGAMGSSRSPVKWLGHAESRARELATRIAPWSYAWPRGSPRGGSGRYRSN
jgi:hypothetical protein